MSRTGPGRRRSESGRRSGRRRAGVRRAGVRRVVVLAALLLPPLFAAACDDPVELEDPVPLFEQVPIQYPLVLWEEGVEGTTLIRVLVSEEGRVDSVAVMETSGHQAFDSAAVEGALDLRFEPALRDGVPVQVWAEVPVHFTRATPGTSAATPGGGTIPEATADEASRSDMEGADGSPGSDGSGDDP